MKGELRLVWTIHPTHGGRDEARFTARGVYTNGQLEYLGAHDSERQLRRIVAGQTSASFVQISVFWSIVGTLQRRYGTQ